MSTAKSNCKESDDLEKELFHIREDLVDNLSAWVVKVTNSQLLHLYSPEKEPVLVFFRHGNPLLYTGRNMNLKSYIIMKKDININVYFISL